MVRVCIFLILVCIIQSYSQVPDPIFRQWDYAPGLDSASINLSLNATGFFRNNEYFNPLYKGYTLLGVHFTPVLEWKTDQRVTISGGVHLLKFSGLDRIKKVLPVLSIQTALTEQLSLLFGTIRGAGEHRLPEPLYGTERNLDAVIEDGIQLRYITGSLFTDLWLQWDRFLERYEDAQEYLTFGYSGWYTRELKNDRWVVTIPLHFLASHKGGQIDRSNLPIQTLFHYSSGLHVTYQTANTFIRKFTASITAIGFADVSPTPQLPMKKGYALYPSFSFGSSVAEWENGFWLAEDFYAPKGDPVYWSWAYEGDTYQRSRRVVLSRLFFKRQLSPHLIVGLRADFLYDFFFKDPDYSYGLFLRFSGRQKICGYRK